MESFVIIGDISLDEYTSIYNNKVKTTKAYNNPTFIDGLIQNSIKLNMPFSLVTSPLLDEFGNEYIAKLEEHKARVFFPINEIGSSFSMNIFQKEKPIISITSSSGIESITPLFLKSIQGAFKNIKYIIVSTKLPFKTLSYIFEEYKDRRIIFYCDNESDYKRMHPYLTKAFLVLINIDNVKAMLNYTNRRPISRYIDALLKQKINATVLIGKGQDIYYGIDNNIYTIERKDKNKRKDNENIYAKFTSGLLYNLINNGTIHEAINIATLNINE